MTCSTALGKHSLKFGEKPLASAGQITITAAPSRQIQLALKVLLMSWTMLHPAGCRWRFLHLFKPEAIRDRITGWRMCWIGGCDNSQVLFIVMVERPRRAR